MKRTSRRNQTKINNIKRFKDAYVAPSEDTVDMSRHYRIYLDACCLNRPFDDQTQPRIFLETQAVLTIVKQCQFAQWHLITSHEAASR
jgi:hypothetical protein